MTHDLRPGEDAWEISVGKMENQKTQPVAACRGVVGKITSKTMTLLFGSSRKTFSTETGEVTSGRKTGFQGLWSQEIMSRGQVLEMLESMKSKGFYEFHDGRKGMMDPLEMRALEIQLGA